MRDTNNDTCKDMDRPSDGAAALTAPSDRGARRVRRRSARRAAAREAKIAAEVTESMVEGAVGDAVEGVADGTADGAADRTFRRSSTKGAAKRAATNSTAKRTATNGAATGGRDGMWAQAIGADGRVVPGTAAGGRFEPTISKERVAALPPIAFGGEIVVVDSAEAIDRACDELLACPLVGFDTESRPSFQKGTVNRISLLQLSTDDKCFLFRLNKIRLDKAILKVLESTSTVKVGLSVAGDIRELETLRRLDPRGFIDLQRVAPQHGIADQSLVRIAAIVLGRRISKAQRLSNWEAVALTDAQKTYAATDAWICTEIYRELTRGTASHTPVRDVTA